MQVNLANYIRQDVRVPKSQGLLPVFEAVSNSLDAIADLDNAKGTVFVSITRHPDQTDGSPGAPKDIQIEDRGIGFTAENFESFCEAFSDRKLLLGGKGRGRFTYLKVFEQAEITSVFLDEGGQRHRREIHFDTDFSGDCSLDPSEPTELKTVVSLENMREVYANEFPKTKDTLIRQFVWHFLPRLLSSDDVDIVITDGGKTSLRSQIQQELIIDQTPDEFAIGRRQFTLNHLRMKPIGGIKHRFIMAAAGREVSDGFHLIRELPILGPGPLPLQEGDQGFVYVALVQGDYLDETVDPLRLGFEKTEDNATANVSQETTSAHRADLLGDPSSIGQVRKYAMEKVEKFLEPFLVEALQDRVNAIDQYIRKDGLGYHFLRSELSSVARDLRALDDSAIESALHNKAFEEKRQRRNDLQQLLSCTPEQKTDSSYFDRWAAIVADMTEIAKSELAEYVAHRRAIIDLMNDRLKAGDDGKHPKEEALHSVIFPRGKQSGEVGHEQQNLWLIDERLAFHEHLYSDLSIKKMTGGEIDSKLRPDLAIFESGFASFHDGNTPPANLVLVELKRSARKDVSRDDPVQSALDYVENIKAGRVQTEGKATIEVDDKAFTTVYILADLTADFRRYLRKHDARELPGGQAFMWFHSTDSIMFIAMSYRRMIDNAAMRNRIFFKKLGIE